MPKSSRFKLVIFDFDGTLFDSLPVKTRVATQLISEKIGCSPEEARKVYLDEYRVVSAIDARLNLSERKRREVAREHLQRKAAALKNAKLFPGVESVLGRLKTAGFKLAIVSSAFSGDASRQLNKIRGFFDEIAFSDPVKRVYVKTPEFVEGLAKRLGAKRVETVFIGDTANDVKVSKKAGVFSVARQGTYSRQGLEAAGPDLIVKDLNEFAEFLLK